MDAHRTSAVITTRADVECAAWRSGEVVGAAEVDYVCLQLRCHRREFQLNWQGKRCHRQRVAEEEGSGTPTSARSFL